MKRDGGTTCRMFTDRDFAGLALALFHRPGRRASGDSGVRARRRLRSPIPSSRVAAPAAVSRDGRRQFGTILRYAPAGAVATQDEGPEGRGDKLGRGKTSCPSRPQHMRRTHADHDIASLVSG